MNTWSNLKVDILKVIENFVEMYPYSPAECVVIEAIANCLDAKATKIDVNLITDKNGKKIFRVIDNGKGMTKEEFEENYHALSVSSKVKGEGIGFAGVGSKLYLVFLSTGERIVTETKSDNLHAASEITVIGGEPKWTFIDKRALTTNGTLYEIRLNEEDANFLVREKIVQIVQDHYNAILLGRYGDITISFAGELIKPWKPELISETATPVVFKIIGKEFRCHFWQARDELNGRQGLEIVVFGKKVKGKQWFDLDYLIKSHLRSKITGQILADGLAPLLTTNKCDFRLQTNPRLWGSFRQKTYDAFGDWLEEIGAMEEHLIAETDPGLNSVCKKLEREINKLLRDPVFLDYNPFLKPQKRPSLIQSPSGDVLGEEVEGTQKTEGTFGGLGIGHGVEVAGLNEGKSIIESASGDKTGVSAVRRVRHGIAINLKDEPENLKESWLTSEAVVINTAHPVFLKCSALGYPAETQDILRCVFFTLLEYNPPQTFSETLDKLRDFYLRWSTV